MRKMISILTLIILFSTVTAHAKDMSNKIGFGVNWFYYLPSEADFDGDTLDNEGTPLAFNIHVLYCLPQVTDALNVALGLDWEYISRDIVAEDSGNFSDDIGTITMMPLMVNAQVRFANLGKITPYIGFGLGVSFNSVTKGEWADEGEEYLENRFPGYNFDVDYDIDHSFAFKVPIGVDVFITDNIALNMEAKYFYTRPDTEITIKGPGYSNNTSDETNQSTFAFGTGMSFYF